MVKVRRGQNVIGWALVWVGVLLLMLHNWTLAWSWLALAVGVSFVVKAVRYPDEVGSIFPGTILVASACGILALQQGWIDFEAWRIWPLFFASAGLGLALLYGLSDAGLWLLAPSGVLMLAGGYGLATRSWYRYLRQLRTYVDLWPAILILIGIVLIFGWWRARLNRKNGVAEDILDDTIDEHYTLNSISLSTGNNPHKVPMPINGHKVFFLILDGYGLRESTEGNGAKLANTPFLHSMFDRWPWTKLSASGRDVGLPAGQMGNSEVGHLNLGAGRIVYQEITRIDKSIETGEFFKNQALIDAVDYAAKKDVAWHLMGLLSDGGVHSSLEHLYALLKLAKEHGVKKVFIHAFMDGRDTPPQSGITYIRALQEQIKEIGVGQIASVTGRYWAMDRDKRWDRVEKAYKSLVHGEGMKFTSAEEATEDSYRRNITDEFIEPSLVVNDGTPVGLIQPGDGIMFFNFRADRARELTRALADPAFNEFAVTPLTPNYTTMTRYQEEFPYPVAFPPHSLDNILAKVLSNSGLTQFRIAETEKYAHVTYFFNGGEEEPFKGETRVLVASPKVATYDMQPEMSASDVADRALDAFDEDYSFILLNFANPDMVGHTGSLPAVIKALEKLDVLVDALVAKAQEHGFVTFISADHGNCEQMFDEHGGPFTAHTTNLVPFVVITPANQQLTLRESGILADVSPTVLHILGLPQPTEMDGRSLIVDA